MPAQQIIQKRLVKKIGKYKVQYMFGDSSQMVYLSSFNQKLYVTKIPCIRTLSQANSKNQTIIKEKNILLKLNHSNIVKMIDFEDQVIVEYINQITWKSCLLVLEFVRESDLMQIVIASGKPFSEQICRALLTQIIQPLIYSHYEKQIMHLDLKLDNILVDHEYHLKVADFGHGKTYLQAENFQKFTYGTKQYVPPQYGRQELFKGQKVDVFNCGIMLFMLLNKCYPVVKRLPVKEDQIYNQIGKNNQERYWRYIEKMSKIKLSEKLKKLLIKMIHPDPTKRYSLKDIIDSQWYKDTKLSQNKELVQLFSKIKAHRNFQRIVQSFYELIQPQESMDNQRVQNTFRKQFQQNCELLKNECFNLKHQNKYFSEIVQQRRFQINYMDKDPSQIIVCLKYVLQNLFQDKQILNKQIFNISVPIEYKLQIVDPIKGIILIILRYGIKSQLQMNQINNQGIQQQKQQDDIQQYDDQIKIKLFGRFLKYQNKYGINWQIEQNQLSNLEIKYAIYQMKSIVNCISLRQQIIDRQLLIIN